MNYAETIMSDYIKGFDAGYDYVLTEIEKHQNLTAAELLDYLKGEYTAELAEKLKEPA